MTHVDMLYKWNQESLGPHPTSYKNSQIEEEEIQKTNQLSTLEMEVIVRI